jgi:hypothetical protein
MQENEKMLYAEPYIILKLARVPASRQNIAGRKKIWMRLRGRCPLRCILFL